ncbi:MAG TPA: flavoprotein [Gammaproteobacteria bacterium]|nr:flavoprotein [Gammaproteobacteria bacterium]
MATNPAAPRLAWALTGSGHHLRECLGLLNELEDVDLFLSAAAAEILTMYGYRLDTLRRRIRVFRDTTASSVPVGLFYSGNYHTLVIAPATSNTVAKCVYGISDTLVTNIYAQAGKCRVPSIVFACDTEPQLESAAPHGIVNVYPRRVDLENTERLRNFEATRVVSDMAQLRQAIERRMPCPNVSCS